MIDGNATLWEEMDLLRDAIVDPFVRRFLVSHDAGAAAGKCLYVDARDLDAPPYARPELPAREPARPITAATVVDAAVDGEPL